MQKFLCFLLVVFFSQNICIAKTVMQYVPYNPYNYNTYKNNEDYGNYPKIDEAEQKLFARTYKTEDITSRLNRLEKKLFNNNYAYLSLSQRTDNIYQNMGFDEYKTISTKDLSKLEQKLFAKTYSKDNAQTRISRLEKKLFGAVQSGDLDDRFEKLLSTSQYYEETPKTYTTYSYSSTPTYSTFQPPSKYLSQYSSSTRPTKTPAIFKNIANFFTEPVITGISPNIVYPNNIPYTPYSYRPMPHNLPPNHFPHNNFNHFGTFPSSNIPSTVNILKN